MPGMTGLELLKIVKDHFPLIRVSMITAYGDENNYRTAMDTGAEHYFTKPIDFGKVKKEIIEAPEAK
jgi:two-component system response regulator (stage 0 sporulation protein F)